LLIARDLRAQENPKQTNKQTNRQTDMTKLIL
jgi:hypothetical protein